MSGAIGVIFELRNSSGLTVEVILGTTCSSWLMFCSQRVVEDRVTGTSDLRLCINLVTAASRLRLCLYDEKRSIKLEIASPKCESSQNGCKAALNKLMHCDAKIRSTDSDAEVS